MGCENEIGTTSQLLGENGVSSILRQGVSLMNEFAEIERQLREFMYVYGITGRMPTILELRYADRKDLLKAIRRQGGFHAVAKKSGLKYFCQKRRTAQEWKDFQEMLSEVQQFIVQNNLQRWMPLKRELCDAGLDDVANSIIRHGGYRYVAGWLGIRYDPHPEDVDLKKNQLKPIRLF